MISGEVFDPHSVNQNSCPANRFGITDFVKLQPIETSLAIKRLMQLSVQPIQGEFDTSHLQMIHRYIFQDIYPWAGEFRQVVIEKKGSIFADPRYLESSLIEVFRRLSKEHYLQGLGIEDFARRSAFYMGELNSIHPFREGNGRAQREFIRELAVNAGLDLVWNQPSQEEMVEASILSHNRGDNSGLERILLRALHPEP